MGEIRPHEPVLPILAVFSRHATAFAWARQRASEAWGAIILASERFDFIETRYYEATMGTGIHKELWAFESLMDPADLPSRKLQTNDWEVEFRGLEEFVEERPLNLDPGYLTEAKLVLATTKDRDHRIYLAGGIYAEVTLYYHGGQWQSRSWTYPDYRRPDYHRFFDRCRDYLRQRYGRTTSRRQSGDR